MKKIKEKKRITNKTVEVLNKRGIRYNRRLVKKIVNAFFEKDTSREDYMLDACIELYRPKNAWLGI